MKRGSLLWSVALAAVVASGAVLGGCATTGEGSAGKGDGEDVSKYLPLAVGNTWTYDRTFLGEKGEEVVQIVRENEGYFVDNKGNAFKVDAHGIRDEKRYLLSVPLEAGNAWKSQTSVSSLERYRILDAGFTCDVPAGRFNDCIRVESKNRIDDQRTMVNEITFAPGVGMVKFDFILEAGEKRIPQGQMVLKSFKVQPPPARS